MRRIYTALLALTVTTAGCDLATAVDPEIQFFAQRVDWTATLVAGAEVDAALGSLLSTGLVLTPNECFTLRMNMQIRNGVISLTINGTQASNQCPATPGAYSFQFLASGIDSGTYQVRILYAIAGRPTETILERSVTIT